MFSKLHEQIRQGHYNAEKNLNINNVLREKFSILTLKLLFPVDVYWLSCVLKTSDRIFHDDTSYCNIYFQNLALTCTITRFSGSYKITMVVQDLASKPWSASSCKITMNGRTRSCKPTMVWQVLST